MVSFQALAGSGRRPALGGSCRAGLLAGVAVARVAGQYIEIACINCLVIMQKLVACSCAASHPEAMPRQAMVQAARTARTLPSVLLSLGIAFFPKCPFCWAAYMSALGSFGLARVPYLPWMLPVLLGLLAVHLLLLLRQLARGRYWPFACSLLGAACILLGRSTWLPTAHWLYVGIALLATGSLLNSFCLSPSFSRKLQLAS